ncbi:MAG: STAS/SEC14 domain-containing protein [Phycisphaerales bacterium]
MIDITKSEGNLMELKASGKIRHSDYERVLPQMESMIEQHGKIRCLIETKDIESIEPKAIMDDLKFDVRHATDFDRVALVTDKDWHQWVTKAWGAFMPTAKVACFAPSERAEAEAWVRGLG